MEQLTNEELKQVINWIETFRYTLSNYYFDDVYVDTTKVPEVAAKLEAIIKERGTDGSN
tara:strand:+ start:415 stop:591 length:177 start_codon:yes stop_codon:yes gene_type:complete